MKKNLSKSPIIRVVTNFILPYICLYSLYIQINGESSPGGGFQAGAIFASAIIAFDLVSIRSYKEYFSLELLRITATIGVLIYAIVGVVSLFFDSNYLDYDVFSNNKLSAQSIGIFLVELGVGMTVASVMCIIYFLLQEE